MNVLYVGLLYPEGWISTSQMRMEELRRLGPQVIPMDTVPYYSWGGKWIGAPFRHLKWGPPVWGLNRDLVRRAQAYRPDVLWVDKGIWVCPRTLREVRRQGVRTLVHYTPDPAIVYHKNRHFLASIPEYDLVVTTKAYEVELYREYGAREVLLQYPSYDRDVHQPQVPTAEEASRYAADVVFVGSYTPGREKYLRPLARAGVHLVVWGSAWDKCRVPELQRHIQGRQVGGRDYALALSCAKIALGILSPVCPDRSTTRSLEIPACGTFLLAERTEEHKALFEEGKEAVFFSSDEELVTHVHYYLHHEEERKRIAAAGRARCLANGHSSADRVKEILDRLHQLRQQAGQTPAPPRVAETNGNRPRRAAHHQTESQP
jgi:glycosyltransferase involved in cell wall biosynthesis